MALFWSLVDFTATAAAAATVAVADAALYLFYIQSI